MPNAHEIVAIVLGALAYSSTDLEARNIVALTGLPEASVRTALAFLVDEGVVWKSSGRRSTNYGGGIPWPEGAQPAIVYKRVPHTYTIAFKHSNDPRIPDDWHNVFQPWRTESGGER